MILHIQNSPSISSSGSGSSYLTEDGPAIAIKFPSKIKGARSIVPYVVPNTLSHYVFVTEQDSLNLPYNMNVSLYEYSYKTLKLKKLFDIKNYAYVSLNASYWTIRQGGCGISLEGGYFYYVSIDEFVIGDLHTGVIWYTHPFTVAAGPNKWQYSAIAHTNDGKQITHIWNEVSSGIKQIDYYINLSTKTVTERIQTPNVINTMYYCNITWIDNLNMFKATGWKIITGGPTMQWMPYFYDIIPGQAAVYQDKGPDSIFTTSFSGTNMRIDKKTCHYYTSVVDKNKGINQYVNGVRGAYWLPIPLVRGNLEFIDTTAFTYAAQDGIVVLIDEEVGLDSSYHSKVWISYKEIGNGHYFTPIFYLPSIVPGMEKQRSFGGTLGYTIPPMNAISKAGFLLGGDADSSVIDDPLDGPLIWYPFN